MYYFFSTHHLIINFYYFVYYFILFYFYYLLYYIFIFFFFFLFFIFFLSPLSSLFLPSPNYPISPFFSSTQNTHKVGGGAPHFLFPLHSSSSSPSNSHTRQPNFFFFLPFFSFPILLPTMVQSQRQ